jgi:serine/threonine-protein kinase
VNDALRKTQDYVYSRYVEGEDHESIDEDAALRILEAHHSAPENADDPDCALLGILYFEMGFESEDRKVDFLRRAKRWLLRAQALADEPWDAVDDRLADIDAVLAASGVTLEEESSTAPSLAAPAASREIEAHGTMVLVPAGPFLFGPAREARTIGAFYVDKFPVTNKQYEAFCRATGYRWPKYWTDARFNGPDQPVVGVSVADATKYCRWVSKDLPSEEQWEKAARGVDGRIYPWGDADPADAVACAGRDPETGKTDPVRAHPAGASPCGALDLAGNVWEWTSTTVTDGEAFQVVKGGCFSDTPAFLRSDGRLEVGPKDKFDAIGFRCIRPA